MLALYVQGNAHKVTGFGVHQPLLSKSSRGSKSTSTIRMFIDATDTDLPFQLFSIPSSAPITSPVLSATKTIAFDPYLEAELLSDASHVALDFSTLFSPNTAMIRLFTLVGRVLLLSSDYIQDKYVSPDEWVFQLFMLVLSTQSFLRSVSPMIAAAASNSTLTVRDRKAFTLLFDIVGLSMLQFKTLLGSKTLEWVQLGANEEIELNGEYMYWLYSGETFSTIPGDYDSTSKSISSRIFGEVHFARMLQESLYTVSKKSKATKEEAAEKPLEASISSQSKIYAGEDGAVLLRMSTTKLLELMNDDNELSVSVQRLVLLCMQEKLSRSSSEEEGEHIYV